MSDLIHTIVLLPPHDVCHQHVPGRFHAVVIIFIKKRIGQVHFLASTLFENLLRKVLIDNRCFQTQTDGRIDALFVRRRIVRCFLDGQKVELTVVALVKEENAAW